MSWISLIFTIQMEMRMLKVYANINIISIESMHSMVLMVIPEIQDGKTRGSGWLVNEVSKFIEC